MALINESQVLGSGSTDLILNTRGKIYVRVNDRFYELNFKGGGNEGNTVVNNTTINNPEQDLSPYVTKKYLKAALGEYVTKRNWEDVMQTKEALENAQLDGFTESITPITVNTMQMVVGTQNLQFDFINSLTDATVVPPSLYINESEQLVCPRGVIKHYTLFGPESVKPNTSIEYYARWTIQGDDGSDYTLLDLEEEDKPYYVYLIVPTTNFNKYTDDYVTEHIAEDPKGQYTGNWFASVEPHAIDELEGYAYLLVAIVTGSNAKGRSIGYLNGFTEILPGQITAYVFKTADGDQYLDFLNRNFKIGDDKSYMSWNTTDGLVVKGKISVIGGDLYDELDNLQKQIDDEIQAWFTSDNPNIENPHVLPSPRLDGDIFIEDILWPTTDWTTDSIKKEHLGDLYYITEGDYSGKIFRYIKDSSNSSINFYWIEVVDNALAEAVKISYIARSEAQNAQNSANNLNQHIISSLSDGVLTQSEIINLENYLKNLQISYGELKRTYDILYQNIFLDTTKKDELKTYFNSLNETYKSLINSVNDIISQPITDPGTTNSELKNLNNIFITTYDNFILTLNNYQNKVIEIQKIINTKIDDNFNNYKYLTESLARSGNTEIKGGLVLTSMIELGSKLSNNFEVTAGINGLTIKPDKSDIAFWAGGDFIDKQYDTILENNHPAKIVLRHDGTGYLANGNISWDKDGYGWVGGDGNNYAIKWNDNGIFLGSGIKITESGQETLATLLEAVIELQSWFGKDDKGDIYIKSDENGRARGLYSYSFVSSAGKSNTPGTGGGTVVGANIDGVEVPLSDGILAFPPYPTAKSLGLKSLAFVDSLAIADVTGLQSTLDGKQAVISDLATIRANANEGHNAYEGLSVVSAVLQSLQSQIDSVANRNDFDEINASAVFADNLSARRVLTGEFIQIGNAVISWDAEHDCLKVDKGLYSTSFLSSAGFSDTGGAGGGTVVGATVGGKEVTLSGGILEFDAYPTTTSLGLKNLAFKDSLAVAEIAGLQSALDGKQAVISDLTTIRANASNGNIAYNDLTTVSAILQSLQAQIDSLAGVKGDEVIATVVSTDIVTAQNAYIAVMHGSLDGNAATATNATYAAYDNSGEHIADNFSKVGAALKSLQSQIDSVASRDFAELSETLLSLKLWIEDMFELTSSGIKAKYDFYSVGAVTSGR